ncbi:MAG: NTP transferase domain-containing protein [Leptospiraceae bacterium]|nr:NTP transferase domain-containing protein [Leptospiraceae bacterium]MCP5496217.1 NTP transferase domain-containing protein [Leptospiraceae bacterium]
MKCFIPAAGFGTRMGDLTSSLPKPLLTISGIPLLEIAIRTALSWGIGTFIVNTHYQADKIHQFLKKFDSLDIIISHEKEAILGTGGGIRTGLEGQLQDNEYFLVLNPDLLLFPESSFYPFPDNFSGDALLYLSQKTEDDQNTSLKLSGGKVYFGEGNYYYIGLGVFKKSILSSVPLKQFFDFRELFIQLSKEGRLFGKEFPGKVVDVGDKELYLKHKDLFFIF